MSRRKIHITADDARRMERCLRVGMLENWLEAMTLKTLGLEMQRARIVLSSETPLHVVTLGTPVRVRDLTTGEAVDVTLVFPEEADPECGRISVRSPIGAAMLGYRAGDTVNLRTAEGLRRIRIERVGVESPLVPCAI